MTKKYVWALTTTHRERKWYAFEDPTDLSLIGVPYNLLDEFDPLKVPVFTYKHQAKNAAKTLSIDTWTYTKVFNAK